MKRIIVAAGLPLVLAGCAPGAADSAEGASQVCERSDVKDVVSKEVRSIMLKQNFKTALGWSALGLNMNDFFKSFDEAKATFWAVRAQMGTSTQGPPFRQIICSAKVSFDLSTAMAGQQIISVPRLRWSVNFAEPTDDPQTAGFSIEVDSDSVQDGITGNGNPLPEEDNSRNQQGDSGQAAAPAADQADAAAANAANAADNAAAAAADFQAASKGGADAGSPGTQRQEPAAPSENDLYAPH